MAEIIGNYETVFIVNATYSDEDIQTLVTKFKSLIESHGTIESVDEWGKRRLAYPIMDMNEGYYVVVNFSAPKDFPAELERVYNITDGLLRSLIVKK